MDTFQLDRLSMMKGRNLNLTKDVQIHHPTLEEIEFIGYDKYTEYLSALISSVLDVADILWFDMEIWYEDIKSEWEFFIQKAMSEQRHTNLKIINEEGQLINIQEDAALVNVTYRDALNFFLGLDGDYAVLEQTQNDLSQIIIFNTKKDKYGSQYINLNSFKFTESFYEISIKFLKDINWMNTKYDFTMGGNKRAKRFMLKQIYSNRKLKSSRKPKITLDSIVSSLISRGHDANSIWTYPIYLIYDQYYRLIKIDEYKNTIDALYNGCIDTKKNPIDWEKINWSNIIT